MSTATIDAFPADSSVDPHPAGHGNRQLRRGDHEAGGTVLVGSADWPELTRQMGFGSARSGGLELASGAEPERCWTSEAAFAGSAGFLDDGDDAEVSLATHSTSSTVIALDDHRLVGIVFSKPSSVAFSWPLAEVHVSTAGVAGVFRKRPVVVRLSWRGSHLDLTNIGERTEAGVKFCRSRELAETVGAHRGGHLTLV